MKAYLTDLLRRARAQGVARPNNAPPPDRLVLPHPGWDPATGRGAGTYLTPTEDLGEVMRELEGLGWVINLLRRHGQSPNPGDSAGSSLPAMTDLTDCSAGPQEGKA